MWQSHQIYVWNLLESLARFHPPPIRCQGCGFGTAEGRKWFRQSGTKALTGEGGRLVGAGENISGALLPLTGHNGEWNRFGAWNRPWGGGSHTRGHPPGWWPSKLLPAKLGKSPHNSPRSPQKPARARIEINLVCSWGDTENRAWVLSCQVTHGPDVSTEAQ